MSFSSYVFKVFRGNSWLSVTNGICLLLVTLTVSQAHPHNSIHFPTLYALFLQSLAKEENRLWETPGVGRGVSACSIWPRWPWKMIDWLIGYLIDWLIDWLVDWWIDWKMWAEALNHVTSDNTIRDCTIRDCIAVYNIQVINFCIQRFSPIIKVIWIVFTCTHSDQLNYVVNTLTMVALVFNHSYLGY